MKISNKVKDINIKNHTYYFFDDIINIKDFDSSNIKIDKKSYKNILTYYIAYVTIKDSKYVKINSVYPLYLMFNRMHGYFEEINGNKYLMLVPTNESKEKIKKYEELWTKINDLIRSVTKKIRWLGWKIYENQIQFRWWITSKQNNKNFYHVNSC